MYKFGVISLILLITGCQQQIKDLNNALANIGSSPATKQYGWEKNTSNKGLTQSRVNESEVCNAYRQNKDAARKKYTGRILQHDGEVQCIIDKPYSWNVGNVISLIRNKNLEEHAKLAITQGVYVSQIGTIISIEDYSNMPNMSDCNISIELHNFNGLF